MTIPPLLVLGVGNPSSGDDALGPLFVERLAAAWPGRVQAGEVELLTDYQLQIEHALDLVGRRCVLFVDASVARASALAQAPFRYERIEPLRDDTASTHALSPAAVLATHRLIAGEPPASWLLAIRGERFELGEPLSEAAAAHLTVALRFFLAREESSNGSF